MYLKGQKLQIAFDSHHREYKNVQKSALKSVNVQRTRKSILQIFAYFVSPTVPRSHFSYPKAKLYTQIISYLYLQIVTSVWENKNSASENK